VPAVLASAVIGWTRSRYGSRAMWSLVLIGTPLVVALIQAMISAEREP